MQNSSGKETTVDDKEQWRRQSRQRYWKWADWDAAQENGKSVQISLAYFLSARHPEIKKSKAFPYFLTCMEREKNIPL